MSELTIAYRVYPRISKHPAAYPSDKARLVALALRSLHRGLGDVDAKFIALLDGCPDSYEHLLRAALPSRTLEVQRLGTPYRGLGNFATFGLQLKLLREATTPYGMFAEDDYYYLPNSIPALLSFARSHREADFISPFDHPAFYWRSIHKVPSAVQQHGDRHWRTINSTCLTFLGRTTSIARAGSVLASYSRGNHDASMWMSLTKQPLDTVRGTLSVLAGPAETRRLPLHAWRHSWAQLLFGSRYTLWAPMPSLATHLESTDLAPGVDWKSRFAEDARDVEDLIHEVGT